MRTRKELLTKIINYEESLPSLIQEISQYGWDCEEKLVELKREHVVKVIQLHFDNKISIEQLIEWADAVEMRDGIEYEEGHEKLIATSLFELSTPEINNPLKKDYLMDIVASLLLRET